jgi:hypothetical protein
VQLGKKNVPTKGASLQPWMGAWIVAITIDWFAKMAKGIKNDSFHF